MRTLTNNSFSNTDRPRMRCSTMLFVTSLLAVSVWSGGASAKDNAAQPNVDRPNVIILMADDMGWGDISYHEGSHAYTPNLQDMANNGLKLENFHSAAPVCSPTRGSVMTGRHPFRYGIFGANVGHLPKEELTIAELLKQKGYATGFFGKWHLGTLNKVKRESIRKGSIVDHYSPPWQHGFDTVFATEAKVPTYDPMIKIKGEKKDIKEGWDAITDRSQALLWGASYWTNEGQAASDNLHGDDSKIIMDRAMPFIKRSVEKDRPFLATIFFHTPHLPVVAGKEYEEKFKGYPAYARRYFASIAAMDEQIGRLRSELRKMGVDKNTLLWFTSDNGPTGEAGFDDKKTGPGSTAGLRGRKNSLFEGGIRVPTIVEWPAVVPSGTVSDIPSVTSDILPTVMDVLSIAAPDNRPIDGESLKAALTQSDVKRNKSIGFIHKNQFALIDGRYKIIFQADEMTSFDRYGANKPIKRDEVKGSDLRFELYDLSVDPGERRNIADKHPEIVKNMATQFIRWRASHKKSLSGGDY
jgi:arylsulfatase